MKIDLVKAEGSHFNIDQAEGRALKAEKVGRATYALRLMMKPLLETGCFIFTDDGCFYGHGASSIPTCTTKMLIKGMPIHMSFVSWY